MYHTPYHMRSRETIYIGPQARRRSVNGLGIAGFIVSLVALVFTLGILSPLGLLLSLPGMFRRPRGLATAGVVLGLAGTLFWGAVGCGVFAGVRHHQRSSKTAHQASLTTQQIHAALTDVQQYREDHGKLPDGIEGNKLAIGHHDAWQRPLRYEIHDQRILVRSAGPDGVFETADDLRRVLNVGRDEIERIDLSAESSITF